MGGGNGAGREEALKAITVVTRVLSMSEALPRGDGAAPPQFWVDWYTYLVTASVAEVERAPESIAGRASARVLCAVAAAGHATLCAVLARVVPVAVEAHVDAVVHERAAANAAVLGLLAGIINTTDPSLSHAPGEHPLEPHMGSLLSLFCNSLGHGAAMAGALAPARGAAPRCHGSPRSRPAPSSRRCLGVSPAASPLRRCAT